jgi:hypothetical protein
MSNYVLRIICYGIFTSFFTISCVGGSTRIKGEIKNTKPSHKTAVAGTNPIKGKSEVLLQNQKTQQIAKPKDTCHVSETMNMAPPFWLEENGIVVTRVLKDCITFDGRKGFEIDTPWMAMGLPCTGGGGKVDWKGHYYKPKLVSYILSTDCRMKPSNLSVVREAGRSSLGLTEKAKLLAYNPFAVQYWEIPGLPDADVGFTVDLRSVQAKQHVWKNYLGGQPIPVKLYGRENAWVMGNHFYSIDAEIIKTGNYTFELVVKKVEAMDSDALKIVKERCEALRPARKCYKVFK